MTTDNHLFRMPYWVITALVAMFVSPGDSVTGNSLSAAEVGRPPNIVLLLADDM